MLAQHAATNALVCHHDALTTTGQPWRSWRLTPTAFNSSASMATRTAIQDRVQTRLATTRVGAAAATSAVASSNFTTTIPFNPELGFPLPKVVPRRRPNATQSEDWLRPGFKYLLAALRNRCSGCVCQCHMVVIVDCQEWAVAR